MKRMLGWIVVALAASFVVFNMQTASVRFLGLRLEMPLAFVLIAFALMGAVASYAFTSLRKRA